MLSWYGTCLPYTFLGSRSLTCRQREGSISPPSVIPTLFCTDVSRSLLSVHIYGPIVRQ